MVTDPEWRTLVRICDGGPIREQNSVSVCVSYSRVVCLQLQSNLVEIVNVCVSSYLCKYL